MEKFNSNPGAKATQMKDKLPLSQAQLKSVILSHGWFILKPFEVQYNNCVSLTVAYNINASEGVFSVRGKSNGCVLSTINGSHEMNKKICADCLSLDINLAPLYKLISKQINKWGWVRQGNHGRFLRSPSLFEDCCKAVLSTNTTWQRTVYMVERLVSHYGKRIQGHISFPSPEKLIETPEETLRSLTGCGFRAKYLADLSRQATLNKPFFQGDAWKNVTCEDFSENLINVKGLGPISVNYLSLIYWKPNGYNLDAYVKRRCKELWGVSERGLLQFLEKRYRNFDEYGPMLLWFEITRHWHKEKFIFNNDSW